MFWFVGSSECVILQLSVTDMQESHMNYLDRQNVVASSKNVDKFYASHYLYYFIFLTRKKWINFILKLGLIFDYSCVTVKYVTLMVDLLSLFVDLVCMKNLRFFYIKGWFNEFWFEYWIDILLCFILIGIRLMICWYSYHLLILCKFKIYDRRMVFNKRRSNPFKR